MKKIILLILFYVLLAALGWTYDLDDIQSIEIKAYTDWGGLKKGEINNLIIKRVRNSLIIENTKKPLDSNMENFINGLLKIINEPIMNNIDLNNFGINYDWLYNNGTVLMNKNNRWEKNQKKLFMENYCNINLIKKILQEQYIPNRMHWTDDYPGFELIIRFKDSIITMQSDSQLPFMLPIKITSNTVNGITYNAMLSIALSNILPDNFILKNRIAGNNLSEYIYELIHFQIRDELSTLETRNKFGDILLKLENNFIIKSSRIATIGSIDLHNETVWDLDLIPKYYFSNLVIELSVSYKDNKLSSMDQFYSKIDNIIKFILNIPWLVKELENKENEIAIRFVDNKSMTDYVQKKFIEDLNKNNKINTLKEINNNLDESVFIIISNGRNYMRCIVLPNSNTILWHYKGSNILLWDESKFNVWDYSGHKGVGEIILSNGELK
jgi:hypothetical protein